MAPRTTSPRTTSPHTTSPWPQPRENSVAGSRMNRRAVIVLMTVGVFIVLGSLMILFFGGLPPWPVTLWFTASHVFFCVVIARVRPFPGPHREPMADPELPTWNG